MRMIYDYYAGLKRMIPLGIVVMLLTIVFFIIDKYLLWMWIPFAWMILTIGFANRTALQTATGQEEIDRKYYLLQIGGKTAIAIIVYAVILYIYLFQIQLYAYWSPWYYILLVFNYFLLLVNASLQKSEWKDGQKFGKYDMIGIAFMVIYFLSLYTYSSMENFLWGAISIMQWLSLYHKLCSK